MAEWTSVEAEPIALGSGALAADDLPVNRFVRLLIAAFIGAALAAPTAASAEGARAPGPGPAGDLTTKAGARTFEQTFPVASRLCARAAAGRLPRRLQASAAQVTQACTTLHSAFDQAQTDLQTALAPLQTQVQAARAQLQQECQSGDRAACRQAMEGLRTTMQGLRDQLKAALTANRTANETARKQFWATIKSLRGAQGFRPDGPTPAAPNPS
jgi:hypothetical protein